MSFAEIKQKLSQLSLAELAEIEQLAAELRLKANEPAPHILEAQPEDSDVADAMDAVFAKRGELLKRLAQ